MKGFLILMENKGSFYEMTGDQRRIFLDSTQLHHAYLQAAAKSRGYRGGMHWKKAKGRDYLFRSRDRFGYGKSLGPRSQKTELIYREFHENKAHFQQKLRELRGRLKEQARFCKAARIARVPRIVGSILRLLDTHKLPGTNLQVVGTNALYAYEAAAGIFFDSGLMATQDMDILWDVRSRLQLHADQKIGGEGLLPILQQADPSFELIRKRGFRAVNRKGYMVDLLKPEPKPAHLVEKRRMGADGDLEAAEIRNLHWLVSSPRFTQDVIGDDGYPAAMVAPDPRAFALHKLWLSRQADREPIKRQRDKDQAIAVCRLVIQYLPHLRFQPAELKMFPKSVVSAATAEIAGTDLPPGYHS
jgi:hypothetical protein